MSKSKILLKLEEILRLLKERESKLLNTIEAAQYLSISNSHLYKLTSQKKIPFHKPSGKYIYFYKHELDEWVRFNSKLNPPAGRAGIKNEKLNVEEKAVNEDENPNQVELFEELGDEEEKEPP